MSLLRAIAAVLALAWIVRGAWTPNWIGSVFATSRDLEAMHAQLEPGGIDYRRFIDDVARSTPEAASIALITPRHRTDEMPSAYTRRAKYLLAPRIVVETTPPATMQTDFVALWRQHHPPPNYDVVWSRGEGSLYRKGRP